MTSRTVTYTFEAKSSLTQAFQQTQRDVNATSGALGSLSQRVSETVREQDKLTIAVKTTGNEYTRLRDQANAAAAASRAAAAEARAQQARSGAGRLPGADQSAPNLFQIAGGFVAAQAAGAAVGAVKDLAGESLRLAGNLEMARGSFTSLLGSAQAADTQIAQLKAFSDKAPLFDTENTLHFAQMLAGAGERAQKLVPDLKEIGAIVAGTGGGTQQLQEVALAYSQVLAQGKLAGQEALQFGNANVPIYKLIAEYLGVSQARARELGQEGKITADVFQQAFSAYAVSHFSDALTNAGNSLQGLQAQVQSGWQNALTTFGQGLETGVKPVLMDIANTLQDPKTLDQIKQWGIAAGQFVTQLWDGAKAVASWAGLDLPKLPDAPDYSALKLDSQAVTTNVQASAASVTDFSKEITHAKSEVEKLRDAQTAANAHDTTRLNAIRDATTQQDRLYQTQLDRLRDQGTQLDRNYQIQKQAKDLAEAQNNLRADARLAGDIFSSVGQAARERYKQDLQKVSDIQGEIAHNADKAANADAMTGVERSKRTFDQGQQDAITTIERERTAREQANQAAIQGWQDQITAYQALQKALSTPDPGITAATQEYQQAYSRAFTGVKADGAQATTDAIADMTAQYRQFYSSTLPDAAGTGRPLIFTALFGSGDEQKQAGSQLVTNFLTGIGDALSSSDNHNLKILGKLAKGDFGGAWDAANADAPPVQLPGWLGGGHVAGTGPQSVKAPNDPPPPGHEGETGHWVTTGDKSAWVAGIPAPFPQNGPYSVPGRAGGGSVDLGWFTVGERGPELLHAGGPGQIVPNGGRGQPVINITVQTLATNEHQLAQELFRILGMYSIGQGVD